MGNYCTALRREIWSDIILRNPAIILRLDCGRMGKKHGLNRSVRMPVQQSRQEMM